MSRGVHGSTIVLFSGDRDFSDMLVMALRGGATVIIASWKHALSQEIRNLKERAELKGHNVHFEIKDLDEYFDKITRQAYGLCDDNDKCRLQHRSPAGCLDSTLFFELAPHVHVPSGNVHQNQSSFDSAIRQTFGIQKLSLFNAPARDVNILQYIDSLQWGAAFNAFFWSTETRNYLALSFVNESGKILPSNRFDAIAAKAGTGLPRWLLNDLPVFSCLRFKPHLSQQHPCNSNIASLASDNPYSPLMVRCIFCSVSYVLKC